MMDIKNTKITVREQWPEIFSTCVRRTGKTKKNTMTRTEACEHTTFPTIIIITESNHGSD
jgi:hypothetical protein